MSQKKWKLSEETRKKMSKAHKGRKHSPETIAKIAAARQERIALIEAGLLPAYKHSPETIKKMKKAAKGRKPSRKCIEAAARANRDRAAERRVAKIVG